MKIVHLIEWIEDKKHRKSEITNLSLTLIKLNVIHFNM